jgi:uncharacterized protein (DUF1015 family)
MAEILPIRPWRYNKTLLKNIGDLTAPLFDVVTDKQRETLYQNPLNSIHLSLPQGGEDEGAATRLQAWKQNGILVQDQIPGVYVYYQYFTLAGHSRTYCRKGFICHVRTYDWQERVILRHENTIPGAVSDRVDLLEKTALHSSATHGLYTDPSHELEKYMDEAITNPVAEVEDYQGARDVLAVIHDATIIRRFVDLLADKSIILADGHHRYEGSLIYKRNMRKKFPGETSKGFNYHLMYLSNTESDDLKILPTHRLIKNIPGFDERVVMEKFEEDFIIKPVPEDSTLDEIIAGKQWAFGIMMKEHCFKVRLKPASFEKLRWPFPELVKKLDLTVMHYFIIEKILGIPGKIQRQSVHLDFNRNYADCLAKVLLGEAQMAIITNAVSIDDVKAVCKSGYTLPQKSTYFYPKVVAGLLFTSMKDEEFDEPVYSPFYHEA